MDPFDLQRFVEAQDPVYDNVRAELAAGTKTSHWMWFVFPQLQGLGRSTMAIRYGIASKEEALAYWQHPILGARLSWRSFPQTDIKPPICADEKILRRPPATSICPKFFCPGSLRLAKISEDQRF